MNNEGCSGIDFTRIVKGLQNTRAKFVSAVGVDPQLFGRLAMMRFFVEFGIGQGGMYSMVPIYDYENGFLAGFLWSGQKRRPEIEHIIWKGLFGMVKYPVNFADRVLRPWYGPPLTYGGIKPLKADHSVIEAARLLGLPRLRLVEGPGGKHSLSAVGFVLSAEQFFVVLHASPVIGCLNVEGAPVMGRRVWLYGEDELYLTRAELKYYMVRQGGSEIRYVKQRVNVLLEITGPLMRGRGACGTYLMLTQVGRRIPKEAREMLPLVVWGRTADSVEGAAEVMTKYVIPSLLILAADLVAEGIEGCVYEGLRTVCYHRASPIDKARKIFASIYEKVRNTISQHLISAGERPYRGPEPEEAFSEAVRGCGPCLVDPSKKVLVAPTITEAGQIAKTGLGVIVIGKRMKNVPLTEYLRAVKSCGVVV